VLPYNESLRYFPSFLQQLEMESNGKSVGIDGQPLACASNPIVWGELGNNGQHAFFQLLHQGGRLVPCDFIAAVRSDYPLPGHQEALLANCFAQSAALAFGKTEDEARSELRARCRRRRSRNSCRTRSLPAISRRPRCCCRGLTRKRSVPWLHFTNTRYSCRALIWGLNSFDQWGVELGKAVANSILPALSDPEQLAKNSMHQRKGCWRSPGSILPEPILLRYPAGALNLP
jgi:glucose-6-phosphate isomerase